MDSDSDHVTQKDIYTAQYAHLGHLNDSLYQMPPIFSAILGGLWYFAAGYVGKDKFIAAGVFLFAAIAGLCFIAAVKSFSLAFDQYLNNLNKFDGEFKVSLKDSIGHSIKDCIEKRKWPSTTRAMVWFISVTVVASLLAAMYAVVR